MALDLQNPKAMFPPRPGLSGDFLLSISSDPQQLEETRDLVSAGPRSSLIYARESVGLIGNEADATAKMTALIAGAPAGSTIALPNSGTIMVQADAISYNKKLRFVSEAVAQGFSYNYATPCIGLLNGGGFGWKIGSASNYAANSSHDLLWGCGFKGVRFSFGGYTFSDAAMVLEGLARFRMEGGQFGSVGSTGSGSRAIRMKAVWDSLFFDNYFGILYNPSGPIIYADQYQTDANGNVNNIKFVLNHFETFHGQLFASHQSSNLDKCKWRQNKFEVSGVSTAKTGSTYAFDLNGASACSVQQNDFNGFSATSWDGLFRIGNGGISLGTEWSDNDYANTNCPHGEFSANEGYSRVHNNRQGNSSTFMALTNRSGRAHFYEHPISTTIASPRNGMFQAARGAGVDSGSGWISALRLGCVLGTSAWRPDIDSCDPGQAVLRHQAGGTGAGVALVPLPIPKLRNFNGHVRVRILARRETTTGTAALRVRIKSTDYECPTLPTLPTAVTVTSLVASGGIVTGTLTAHGFAVGDLLSITGANESAFNASTGAFAQVLSVPDADHFTYAAASATGTATGTISARRSTWATTSVVIPQGALAALGDGSDVAYVAFGTGNNNVIDIDAVAFDPAEFCPQTIAYSATVTPDPAMGNDITIGALTGNVTVANPTVAPAIGTPISVSFVQDGTGSRTIAWGNLFKGWPTAGGTANQKLSVYGRWNGTNYVFLGSSGWYS